MDKKDLIFKPNQGLLKDRVRELAELPLAFQPGTRWEYSVGTDVLGRVVEVVSGQTLKQFFRQEILAPLEMRETGFSVPAGAGDRFASLYTPLAGDAMALNSADQGGDTLRLVDAHEASPFANATTFSGGGGLVSTIDGLCQIRRHASQSRVRQRASTAWSENSGFHDAQPLAGRYRLDGTKELCRTADGGHGIWPCRVHCPETQAGCACPGSVGDFSWGGMASTYFWIDWQNDLTAVFFTQLSPSSFLPIPG